MLDKFGITLGTFEMLEPIGSGGMGSVWRGRHRRLGYPVAVKTLSHKVLEVPEGLALFHREVRTQASLHHPGIAKIFDYGVLPAEAEAMGSRLTAGNPYLVMEYADAGTLRDVEVDGWMQMRTVFLEVLAALAHAHARQYIHRDVKPENILVFGAHEGARRRYKLADFGLTHMRQHTDGEPPAVSAAAGSPLYMAPEQIRGHWRLLGSSTDLYQLGCVAFEMLSGRPPYVGTLVPRIAIQHLEAPVPALEPRMAVPDGIAAWVERLMAKEPRARFRCAADAAQALRALDAADPAKPTQARITSTWKRADDEASTTETDADDRPADVGPADVGLGLFGLREVPFIGRAAQRDALWEELRRAAATNRPRAVVVRGASGTGKSRLAEWVAQRAHEVAGCQVLRALHEHNGAPFAGLRAMVESWLQSWGAERGEVWELARRHIVTGEPEAGQRQAGQRKADKKPSFAADDARALTELLRPTDDDASSDDGPSFQLSSRAERLVFLGRLLRHLSTSRPTIVWLDDVQWSAEAAAFTEHYLDRVGEGPVLFLLTVRDDEVCAQPAASERLARLETRVDVEPLQLLPLEADEHRRLLERLLPLQPDLADLVHRRTEGRPLFAVQLVGAWVDDGVLEAQPSGFGLTQPADDLLPDDIHDLWMSRLQATLAHLGAEQRDEAMRSLELAATLGRQIDPVEWRAACREAGISPAAGLLENDMVERRLIMRDADGLAFVHGMLVESLQRHSRQEGRAKMHHRACARAMEELEGTHVGATHERQANFWLAAGELQCALEPMRHAAVDAQNRGDYQRLATLLDRRMEVIDELGLPDEARARVENWLMRVELLRVRGKLEEASALIDRAREVTRRQGFNELLFDVEYYRGYLHLSRGQADAALTAANAAIEAADEAHDTARGYYLRAHVAGNLLQRFDEAETYYQKARDIFEADDSPQAVLKCEMNLATVLSDTGQHDLAEAYHKRLQQRARETGNRFVEARVTNSLGEIARARGDWATARDHYGRFRELNQANGSPANVAIAELNIALCDLGAADFEAASTRFEALVDEFERLGWETLLGHVFLGASVCAAGQQRWEAWQEYFRRTGENLATHSRRSADQLWLAEQSAEWADRRGRGDLARRAYELAASIGETIGENERAEEARRKARRHD
jgi:tetratricopeptide (TPR) repeat protein